MLYRITVIEDPSGCFSDPESKLKDVLDSTELAFCFDTQTLSVEREVARLGRAMIVDELSGATLSVAVDGAEEIDAATLAGYAQESRRIGEDGR